MADLETFRADVRQWLADNYPAELKDPRAVIDEEAIWGGRAHQGSTTPLKVWMDRMASRGFTAPTWPKAYGGGGLSADEALVLDVYAAREDPIPGVTAELVVDALRGRGIPVSFVPDLAGLAPAVAGALSFCTKRCNV
jgi:alkylation response protein AidB-like acyl-CoA dehydrogenase